jgi:2-iminobutanoate/2-iminopropanoate deaminase
MNMQFIQSPLAPAAVGPYSQAVRSENLLFCSGQIGLDPQSGQLVSFEFAAQAEQVFKNLSAVLMAAGSSLQDVVRVEVFLANIEDFAQLNGIYERWFGYHKPARQTVEVSKLPKDALVEISVIATVN